MFKLQGVVERHSNMYIVETMIQLALTCFATHTAMRHLKQTGVLKELERIKKEAATYSSIPS